MMTMAATARKHIQMFIGYFPDIQWYERQYVTFDTLHCVKSDDEYKAM